MGLSAIWILASAIVDGDIMGIFGIVLSVPIAATIYRLIREDLKKPAAIPATEQKGKIKWHNLLN